MYDRRACAHAVASDTCFLTQNSIECLIAAGSNETCVEHPPPPPTSSHCLPDHTAHSVGAQVAAVEGKGSGKSVSGTAGAAGKDKGTGAAGGKAQRDAGHGPRCCDRAARRRWRGVAMRLALSSSAVRLTKRATRTLGPHTRSIGHLVHARIVPRADALGILPFCAATRSRSPSHRPPGASEPGELAKPPLPARMSPWLGSSSSARRGCVWVGADGSPARGCGVRVRRQGLAALRRRALPATCRASLQRDQRDRAASRLPLHHHIPAGPQDGPA
jgi:hypothetical protein